jgi:hypothetical protein
MKQLLSIQGKTPFCPAGTAILRCAYAEQRGEIPFAKLTFSGVSLKPNTIRDGSKRNLFIFLS